MKTKGYFMSESVPVKMNLYQKLIEMRKAAVYVSKGDSGYNFKYASTSDLLGAIRPIMDDLGVLLVTNMEKFERVGTSDAGKPGMTVTLSYTWVNADNPAEQLRSELTFFEDKMTGCQGIGSILTYGERYFLYKALSVATDKDAPEQFYKAHNLSAFAEEEEQEPQQEHSKPVFRRTLDFWFTAAPRFWELLRKNDESIYVTMHDDLPYYLHLWQLACSDEDVVYLLPERAKNPKKFLAQLNSWLSVKENQQDIDDLAHNRAYALQKLAQVTA
jgi:hypothetical protein